MGRQSGAAAPRLTAWMGMLSHPHHTRLDHAERRRNAAMPSTPMPSNASDAGSGTAAGLALNVPLTLLVNEPMLLPTCVKPGNTLAKPSPIAAGKASVVMTLLVNVSVSGGAPTDNAPPGPVPNVTSVKMPLRKLVPVLSAFELMLNEPLNFCAVPPRIGWALPSLAALRSKNALRSYAVLNLCDANRPHQ